jgi:hypothetical protein
MGLTLTDDHEALLVFVTSHDNGVSPRSHGISGVTGEQYIKLRT